MVGTYLPDLKKLVLSHMSGYKARVYLFGSYARGEARPSSDVDIAILPLESSFTSQVIVDLKDKLEESTIPYFVDVVDLSKVDPNFKKQILSEAILWKG